MKISKGQSNLLLRQEYFDIILCILDHYDYASKIAKKLGKSQPTVTEQLKLLEGEKIIFGERKGITKKFEVDFRIIVEYVYSFIEELRDYRLKQEAEEVIDVNILTDLGREAIKKGIPPQLIQGFFDIYSFTVLDQVYGLRKSIDEVVISFFGALYYLDKRNINTLISTFKINKKDFERVVELMTLESITKEYIAIRALIDFKTKRDSK